MIRCANKGAHNCKVCKQGNGLQPLGFESKRSALRRFELIWKDGDKCAHQYNNQYYNYYLRELPRRAGTKPMMTSRC